MKQNTQKWSCTFFRQYGNRPFALAAAHGCVRMLEMLMEESYNMATMEENEVHLLYPSVCRCLFYFM